MKIKSRMFYQKITLIHGKISRATAHIQLVLLALILLHAPLSATASSRDTAKQQLAIRAAAKETMDNLETIATTNATDITILTAAIRNTMLQDAKKYNNADKSLALCKNILIAQRKIVADNILKNAVLHASRQSPLPITEKDITARLGSTWNDQVTLASESFADNFILQIYSEARTDAIARQRTEIEKSVSYPEFQELDAKLTKQAKKSSDKEPILNSQSFNAMLPWIKSSIVSKIDTFAENQPTINKLGEKILGNIQTEYEQQIEIVDNAIANNKVPATDILKTEIEKQLTGILNINIPKITSTTGNNPYPIFNITQQYSEQQSQQLQNKRLQDFISKPGIISIGNNAKQIIKETPDAHRNPKTSKKTLQQMYSRQQRPIIAEKYAAQAGKNRNSDTIDEISGLINSNPDITKTFQTQIDASLDKILPPIRASIAQEQFKTTFPALANKTPFTEPMIEFIHNQQTTNIKNISMLTKVLAVDSSYTTRPHRKEKLLKETDTLAINTANELAEPLVLALGAQLQTLSKLEQANLEQLRRDIADKKSFKTIKQDWQNELLKRWKQQSDKYPEQAQTLFQLTQTQLNKTVRQLYDATKNEEVKEEQTEPIKIEETSSGKKTTSYDSERTEVPDPEKEEEEEKEKEPKPEEEKEPNDDKNSGIEENLTVFKGSADFVLRLSDAPDGRCRVIFGCPAEGTSLEAHFMPTDIEAAADTIATAINEQFAETLQNLAESAQSRGLIFWKKTTPHIRVLVLENSKETRHITSILLQKKIKEQIKTWSEKEDLKFKLDWQESPGLTP